MQRKIEMSLNQTDKVCKGITISETFDFFFIFYFLKKRQVLLIYKKPLKMLINCCTKI